MGIVRRVADLAIRFAAYVIAAQLIVFPRIPEDAPHDLGEVFILMGALVAIGLAISSTMDWIQDTARDIIARRKAKRDTRDRAASGDEGGHPGAGDHGP